MRQNASVVFDEIRKHANARIAGPHDGGFNLLRPEFYLDGSGTFEANHCYVASADHLPARPHIEENVLLVLLGTSPRTTYYQDRCCMIHVTEELGIFELFNLVQSIFDKYDKWDEQAREYSASADIAGLIKCGAEVLDNPCGVMDKEFRYIGLSDPEKLSNYIKAPVELNQSLGPDLLKRFMDSQGLHNGELSTMNERQPLFFDIEGFKTMNLNLFEEDEYAGCLTIWSISRPFIESDALLAGYLRKYIEPAMADYSIAGTSERDVLLQALRSSIEGIATSYDMRHRVESITDGRAFFCAKLEFNTSLSNLPIGYMIKNIEDAFPGSVAFEYDRAIVALIDVDNNETTHAEEPVQSSIEHDDWKQTLFNLAHTMDLKVGISNSFTDVLSSRLYYLQASAVISDGRILDRSGCIYEFDDYALTELVINSMGELPLELFYYDGLNELFMHDAKSQTNYEETLNVYLGNNLNLAQTARDLYVHRSTLIERLDRIEKILDVDLRDPDTQLYLRIILKARTIHALMLGQEQE